MNNVNELNVHTERELFSPTWNQFGFNIIFWLNKLLIILVVLLICITLILGDPGADSGDEEKSKRAEKYMARIKVKNGEKSP